MEPTHSRRRKDPEPFNQVAGTPATVPTAMGEITNPVERLAREPTHDDIARRAYSSLVARIRGEYDEMPGLRLTFAQACRLWQVDARTCQMLLEQLVRESFLHKTLDGAYIALPSPRQQAKAQLQEHVRFPRSA